MAAGVLITNGEVYDGGGGPPVRADVRVQGADIVEIAPGLPARGDRVIDASGLLVTPGLIDLHVHVYSGMGIVSVDAEEAGLRTGVTTLLDTGSAGALTYPTFHRFVMPQAREDIFALLNISMIGCIHFHTIPPYLSDLTDSRNVHVPAAVACIEKHRDRLLGTKVRLTSAVAGNRLENERAAFEGALEAAARTGTLCMIHHALSEIPLEEVLRRMRPGDIYTHLYFPSGHFSPADGAPPDAMRDARARGVLFDVGHGVGAFAWDVAEPACRNHGFWPDTISTDIHQLNVRGPVFDMPTTMSKFLHLGMPLAKVIQASTQTPARAMRLGDRFGTLQAGRQADIALLRIERGRWSLADVQGQVRVAGERIAAAGVLKRGEVWGIGISKSVFAP